MSIRPEEIKVVPRGPEPGGWGGTYRAFGETLRGLKTTFSQLTEGVTTVQYPEEKIPVYPRFRGRHRLHKFADTGLEKCVGCSLCAAACPYGLEGGCLSADTQKKGELGDDKKKMMVKYLNTTI